jgi:hypothetical protein
MNLSFTRTSFATFLTHNFPIEMQLLNIKKKLKVNWCGYKKNFYILEIPFPHLTGQSYRYHRATERHEMLLIVVVTANSWIAKLHTSWYILVYGHGHTPPRIRFLLSFYDNERFIFFFCNIS